MCNTLVDVWQRYSSLFKALASTLYPCEGHERASAYPWHPMMNLYHRLLTQSENTVPLSYILTWNQATERYYWQRSFLHSSVDSSVFDVSYSCTNFYKRSLTSLSFRVSIVWYVTVLCQPLVLYLLNFLNTLNDTLLLLLTNLALNRLLKKYLQLSWYKLFTYFAW